MGRAPITQRTVKKADDFGMDVIAKPFRQLGRDVLQGGKELIRQGQAATANVVEGARKVKRFLSK
jgi:hypothetical protein